MVDMVGSPVFYFDTATTLNHCPVSWGHYTSIPDAKQIVVAKRVLEAQIREVFGRVAFSHKTHEKCSDIYTQRLAQIKIIQIVLSALTTGSLLRATMGEGKEFTLVGAALAAMSLALNVYTKDYDLGKLAQRHADAASRLWAVREAYLSLLTDIVAGSIEEKQIRTRRDELQHKLEAIYQSAPRTTDQAYSKAQTALQVNDELTFSDEEIDKFLPVPLRKTRL